VSICDEHDCQHASGKRSAEQRTHPIHKERSAKKVFVLARHVRVQQLDHGGQAGVDRVAVVAALQGGVAPELDGNGDLALAADVCHGVSAFGGG